MSTAPLDRVIEAAQTVARSAPNVSSAGVAFIESVFRSLAASPHPQFEGQAVHDQNDGFGGSPAGAFFGDAIARAQEVPGPTASLAAAVRDVTDQLRWYRRPSGLADPDGFHDGHVNGILIGSIESNGLVQPDDVTLDVTVGMTLMAPNARYPDHHHPPEEFYIVLSPGQWRQGDHAWHEPGPGGVVVHAPGVIHAMRSGDEPLLALWFLRMPRTVAT